MGNFTRCPHCNLMHSIREDGLCPRCRQPVAEAIVEAPPPVGDSGPPQIYEGPPPPEPGGQGVYQGPAPYAPPRASSFGQEPAAEDESFPLGARIAGIILILNGVFVAWENVAGLNEGSPLGGNFAASSIVDIVLGILLLAGNEKWLLLAKIRAVGGLIVFGLIYFAQGDVLMGVLQVTFSATLLGLLIGRAGVVRMALCTSVAGIFMALNLVGLLVDPEEVAETVLDARGELEPIPEGGLVRGTTGRFQVSALDEGWFIRAAQFAKQDNPIADRWLIKPSLDAHVLIIEEQVERGTVIDLRAFAEVVKQNVRGTTTAFELKAERSINLGNVPGRFLHIAATAEGAEIEYYIACLVRYELAYQIVGFSTKENFPSAAAEIQQIIDSFQLRGI